MTLETHSVRLFFYAVLNDLCVLHNWIIYNIIIDISIIASNRDMNQSQNRSLNTVELSRGSSSVPEGYKSSVFLAPIVRVVDGFRPNVELFAQSIQERF